MQFNTIVGIESGGFIQGPILAQFLGVPFIPIRRGGYLPGEIYRHDYRGEYGQQVIEIQKDNFCDNPKVLIVDDML